MSAVISSREGQAARLESDDPVLAVIAAQTRRAMMKVRPLADQ